MMREGNLFTIYVVEDNEWYNKLLVHTLSLNPDYIVKSFSNAKDFLAQLETRPDVVTLDYVLPDMGGNEVMQKIKQFDPNIEVIIISEQNKINVAVELLHAGAYDYIVKERDIKNRLLNTINHIRKTTALKTKISTLENEVKKKYDFNESIVGNSAVMDKVKSLIEKALTTNITVIVTGETGTGKEVVAKAIHYNSSRGNKPFIAVNVAAIPSELIESELFGYEKGAFTGAAGRRIGKFEEAHEGTIFLDEIGEMDLAFQAKLLRVLQEREITRLGNNIPVKIDCRIIVATHRNLKEEVKKGKFREDLYYRLFGLPIDLPPLRDRENDILLLAKKFIQAFCKENKIPIKSLSEGAQKKLMSYSFPGNVRELKSIIDLAIVMGNYDEILPEDIILASFDVVSEVISQSQTLREYNLRIVNTYLQKFNNDIKRVAKELDISQATIYRMLKEMELPEVNKN